MQRVIAYKTELNPNNRQRTAMRRCAGIARFVYDWALADHERRYEENETTSIFAQCKAFNAIKYAEHPFVVEAPYAVTESVFRNLDAAFKRYFREKKDGTVARRIARLKAADKWAGHVRRSLKKGRHGFQLDPGYPRFKSKYKSKPSFQLRNTRTEPDRVRLTHIGWVRLKEKGYLPTEGDFCTYATISERAGRWYISVQVKEERPSTALTSSEVIGVDFGVKVLATCSNGIVFENPKPLKEAQKRLKRLGRELSRRKRGGQNWKKTKYKIARAHARIANMRQHVQHQISHYLTHKISCRVIVLENLNVSGMMKNRCLAQAIADVGFYELRRQIEYKAEHNGIEVVLADRWEPTSKLCSRCGWKWEDLKLSDRTFRCEQCGLVIDRDLNAALNLAALAEPRNTRGLPVELVGLPTTVKQEVGCPRT